MSIKDLFGKTSKDLEETVQDVESVKFVEEKSKQQERYLPPVDFSDPKNFVYYGSAELYYDAAIRRIYEDYPYDGSKAEQIEFEEKSSHLERWLFENRYPKTTGYVELGTSGDIQAGNSFNEFYVKTNIPEFIRVWGGLHTDTEVRLKDKFEKSAKFDEGTNRNQNWNCDWDKGITVEFWMNKQNYVPIFPAKEVILDLWNGISNPSDEEYSRLIVSSFNPLDKFGIQIQIAKGSTIYEETIVPTNKSFEEWNHFSIAISKDDNQDLIVKPIVNGVELDQVALGPLDSFSGRMDGFIGALQTSDSNGDGSYGHGKLSAHLDEFRFWKTARTARQIKLNWFSQVGGGANTDDATSDLGVYFKFNEGIVGNSVTDSVVLDYSGRLANGLWIGYPGSSARNTGSAIETVGYTEKATPIIYSNHPEVTALSTEMQTSGSIYDTERGQAFFNSMPTWLQQEDNGNLRQIAQILGSYLDTLHVQIKQMTELKNKDYTPEGLKASTMAQDLLKDKGFLTSNIFGMNEVYEKLSDLDIQDNQFESDLNEIKNTIYTNIYNNLEKIYKSKGTETSIRNFIRCFGIDDELVKLNLYTDGGVQYLSDKSRITSVKKKYINFNHPDHFSATIYQTFSDSNANTFIDGSSTGTNASNNAFTLEADIVVPYKKERGENGYFGTPFLSSSVFGFHEANDAAAADYDWAGDKDLQVHLVRDSIGSNHAKFVLKNEAETIYQESDYVYDIYDNEHYNIAIRIKPQTYPYAGGVTNTTPDYDIELYAVTNNLGEIKEVLLSQTVSFAIGSAYMNVAKRVYAGAHRQDFKGDVLQKSDVQIGSIRAWLDYLGDEEIQNHNKDVLNYGSRRSIDGSNIYTVEGQRIPTHDLTILNWDFDTVLASDGSGQFIVEDITSGSTDTIYGWVDDIIRREHRAQGDFFPSEDSSFLSNEFLYSLKKQLPETAYNSENIFIKGEQEINFSDDDDVSDNLFILEKSPANLVSEEMLKSFSTTMEFANLVGRPIDRYRLEYKDLAKARELFFKKVESDLDFDRFFEYFKWIDSSISSMVNQLIPLSANFAGGIVDVIEPHILERDKYQRQIGLLNTVTSTEASIRGVQELKYSWKFGHAPLPIEQTDQGGPSGPTTANDASFIFSVDDVADGDTISIGDQTFEMDTDIVFDPSNIRVGFNPTNPGQSYDFLGTALNNNVADFSTTYEILTNQPSKGVRFLEKSENVGLLNYPNTSPEMVASNEVTITFDVYIEHSNNNQDLRYVYREYALEDASQKRFEVFFDLTDFFNPILVTRVHYQTAGGSDYDERTYRANPNNGTFLDRQFSVRFLGDNAGIGNPNQTSKVSVDGLSQDLSAFSSRAGINKTADYTFNGFIVGAEDIQNSSTTGFGPTNTGFVSNLDEIVICNTELPPADRANLHNGGKKVLPSEIPASAQFYYSFDDPGDSLDDGSTIKNFINGNRDLSVYNSGNNKMQFVDFIPYGLEAARFTLSPNVSGEASNLAISTTSPFTFSEIVDATGGQDGDQDTSVIMNEAENCLWHKERRERNEGFVEDVELGNSLESIRQVLVRQNDQEFTNPINLSSGEDIYSGSYAVRRLSRPYSLDIGFSHSIHGGINYDKNKDRDFLPTVIRPHGALGDTGAPENIMTIGAGIGNGLNPLVDCSDVLDPNKLIKRDGYAQVGKFSDLNNGNPKTDEEHFLYRRKVSQVFPGNIVSSSVNTGYSSIINRDPNDNGFAQGLDVVNLHSDTTDITNEIPMQGPFTQQWMGGHQSRHVEINRVGRNENFPDELDNQETRPEAWRFLVGQYPSYSEQNGIILEDDNDGAIGFTGPDYGGEYPISENQKAIYYREERAKRPVNIKNIKTIIGAGSAGNYVRGYEVFSTFGDQGYFLRRHADVSLLPEQIAEVLPQTTNPLTLVAQTESNAGNVFGQPNNRFDDDVAETQDRSTGSVSTIRTKFSAPGGPEVNTSGYLDVATQQYSVHNSINFRNLAVRSNGSGEYHEGDDGNIVQSTIRVNSHSNRREGLRTLRARHQGQFGIDSKYGAISATDYISEASFHKQHRNGQEKLTPVVGPARSMRFSNTISEYLEITNLSPYGEVDLRTTAISFNFWCKLDNKTDDCVFFYSRNVSFYRESSSYYISIMFEVIDPTTGPEDRGPLKLHLIPIIGPGEISFSDELLNWSNIAISIDVRNYASPQFRLPVVTVNNRAMTFDLNDPIPTWHSLNAYPKSFAGVVRIGGPGGEESDYDPGGSLSHIPKEPLNGSIMNFSYFNSFIHDDPVALEILSDNTRIKEISDIASIINFWFLGEEVNLQIGDYIEDDIQLNSVLGSYTETFISVIPSENENVVIAEGFYNRITGAKEGDKVFNNDHYTSLLPSSDFQYSWINSTLSGSDSNGVTWNSRQRIFGFSPKNGQISNIGDGYVDAIAFPEISEIECALCTGDVPTITLNFKYDTAFALGQPGDWEILVINEGEEEIFDVLADDLADSDQSPRQIWESDVENITILDQYEGCCEDYPILFKLIRKWPSGTIIEETDWVQDIPKIPKVVYTGDPNDSIHLELLAKDCRGYQGSLMLGFNNAVVYEAPLQMSLTLDIPSYIDEVGVPLVVDLNEPYKELRLRVLENDYESTGDQQSLENQYPGTNLEILRNAVSTITATRSYSGVCPLEETEVKVVIYYDDDNFDPLNYEDSDMVYTDGWQKQDLPGIPAVNPNDPVPTTPIYYGIFFRDCGGCATDCEDGRQLYIKLIFDYCLAEQTTLSRAISYTDLDGNTITASQASNPINVVPDDTVSPGGINTNVITQSEVGNLLAQATYIESCCPPDSLKARLEVTGDNISQDPIEYTSDLSSISIPFDPTWSGVVTYTYSFGDCSTIDNPISQIQMVLSICNITAYFIRPNDPSETPFPITLALEFSENPTQAWHVSIEDIEGFWEDVQIEQTCCDGEIVQYRIDYAEGTTSPPSETTTWTVGDWQNSAGDASIPYVTPGADGEYVYLDMKVKNCYGTESSVVLIIEKLKLVAPNPAWTEGDTEVFNFSLNFDQGPILEKETQTKTSDPTAGYNLILLGSEIGTYYFSYEDLATFETTSEFDGPVLGDVIYKVETWDDFNQQLVVNTKVEETNWSTNTPVIPTIYHTGLAADKVALVFKARSPLGEIKSIKIAFYQASLTGPNPGLTDLYLTYEEADALKASENNETELTVIDSGTASTGEIESADLSTITINEVYSGLHPGSKYDLSVKEYEEHSLGDILVKEFEIQPYSTSKPPFPTTDVEYVSPTSKSYLVFRYKVIDNANAAYSELNLRLNDVRYLLDPSLSMTVTYLERGMVISNIDIFNDDINNTLVENITIIESGQALSGEMLKTDLSTYLTVSGTVTSGCSLSGVYYLGIISSNNNANYSLNDPLDGSSTPPTVDHTDFTYSNNSSDTTTLQYIFKDCTGESVKINLVLSNLLYTP